MAKWCDEGELRVAQILFGSQAVDSTLYLGLYTNSTEPAESATLSSLTEASGSGYSRKTLTRGSWTVASSIAEYAQQVFTATGDWGNVYGYFIATSSDNTGKLLCVEQFSTAPFNVTNGSTVQITPKVTVS